MKWNIPWETWREKSQELLGKYKYVLLVILAGAALLLWPSAREGPVQAPPAETATAGAEEDFSVSALEEKLSQTLSKIQGAGDVTVMLTVQGGSRRVLAVDEKSARKADGGSETQSTTVVVSSGSGAGNDPVLVQQLYPRFQGALVVCSGGENAGVRLKLMEAVSALTGLGADKISICKGKG